MIVVKDTHRLTGKGCKDPEAFLGCPVLSVADADGFDFRRYGTAVFHLCEEWEPVAFKQLAPKVREQGCRIVNDPSICDIGDKHATMQHISEQGGIPGVSLPWFRLVHTLGEAYAVDRYPCIVRELRRSGGAGMALVRSPEQMIDAMRRLGILPVQVVEFIDTDHDRYASVRINWIGDTLLDWWCRPASAWNVHVSKTDKAAAVRYDDMFREWLAGFDMPAMLREANSIFGVGWYSMDAVWAGDRLWFAELGYKVFDHHHERELRGLPFREPKRSRDSVYAAIREALA